MEVITTHVNADFDCLGSMLAAKKLYPDALMVFSGSQEKSVRKFLLKYRFNFTRLKTLDLNKVTRLILVDCQHASRIGPFAAILQREGLDVHIYDHHPEVLGHIPSNAGVIRSCGSTAAIFATILRENGVTLSKREATAVMLGIYEDTGNLTYHGTSVEDFYGAAWLLTQGAQLSAVGNFLAREITAEQVSLLNDLLHSMKRITIGGLDVCLATASLDYYLGDIATLASMMRDMESLETLFMVVGMGNRVYIIGRSGGTTLDVGETLRSFGGGGHAAAGSATVKGLTVIQVLHRLETVLVSGINTRREIAAIMSSPVKTITAASSISEARLLLTRYNVNALPVMDGDMMVGVISRRIVEKALYHNLGDVPVTDYMHTEFVRLKPDTPIMAVKEYLTGENQRFAPVFSNGLVVGVVTRTDLFRYINSVDNSIDPEMESEFTSRDMLNKFRHSLSRETMKILHNLGRVGDELDLRVYVVGGFIRDLLLGEPSSDLDVTVEGDGILFAEKYAAEYDCRVKSHSKFGTATIIFPDASKIDVASTRLEYYDSPGVLPTVERSSLKMDLYRRDFTINTLAISLSLTEFGRLIDFFGARRDLKEKKLKVLHNLSFVEDPTRVFRGVRFEQRLGFKMAPHTEALIKNSIKMNFLDKLGGRRLFTELVHIFEEKEPQYAVKRIASLGALKYIHKSLEINDEIMRVFKESANIITWFELLYLKQPFERWVVYMLATCSNISADDFVETCIRLDIGTRFIERYFEARIEGEKALEKIISSSRGRGRSLLPSEVCALLRGLPVEILLHLMARTDEDTRRQFSIYITNLSQVTTIIDGNDLKELGFKPCPAYKSVLDSILNARLDGRVASREDELALARELIKYPD